MPIATTVVSWPANSRFIEFVADVASLFAPGAELVTVGVRHTEQLADDLDGQRQRQRLVQVRRRSLPGQVIEQGCSQFFHAGLERAHSLG
jgi:hypothetical protein